MATAVVDNTGLPTSCPEKDTTPYERIVLEPTPDLEKEIEEAKGSDTFYANYKFTRKVPDTEHFFGLTFYEFFRKLIPTLGFI